MTTPKLHKRNAGFTLIETMIVVAIIGVIAGITIPAFGKYMRSQRVAGARAELISNIAYTKSLAIAKRTTFRIEFDAGEYRIVRAGPDTIIRTKVAPVGITFSATADPNFYAWGLSDAVDITLDAGASVINLNLLPNGTVTHP